MEDNKMKKLIEPKVYTQEELLAYVKNYIQAVHNIFAKEEQRYGKRIYTTFGEWKKKNPKNPVAKKNYPEDEYIEVIAEYKTYFNKMYAEEVIECDF